MGIYNNETVISTGTASQKNQNRLPAIALTLNKKISNLLLVDSAPIDRSPSH